MTVLTMAGLALGGPAAVLPCRKPSCLGEIARIGFMRQEPTLQRWFREADEGRACQNAHGEPHGFDTWQVGCYVGRMLGFTPHEMHILSIACYTHDIGSRVGQVNHEEVGACMIRDWMKGLGAQPDDAEEVYEVIASHRTTFILGAGGFLSRVCMAQSFADRALAASVKRVREEYRRRLDEHEREGDFSAWLEQEQAEFEAGDPNLRHIRINHAVRSHRLAIDKEAREMSLALRTRRTVASHADILALFHGKYQVLDLGAQYVSYHFRAHLDSSRYFLDRNSNQWVKLEDLILPRPNRKGQRRTRLSSGN
jgi:hypothetical protein